MSVVEDFNCPGMNGGGLFGIFEMLFEFGV